MNHGSNELEVVISCHEVIKTVHMGYYTSGHFIFEMTTSVTFCLSYDFSKEPFFALIDTDSTAPKRGSVFIGLITPDGAI